MRKKLVILCTALFILLFVFITKASIISFTVKLIKFIIAMNPLQIIMSIFILAILFITVAYCNINKVNMKSFFDNNLLQIFVILFMVSIFNLAAYQSDVVKIDKSFSVIWQIVVIWLITVILGVVLICRLKDKNNINIVSIKKLIQDNKFITFCLLFITIIRVPMLWTMQRWDAGEYYYGLGTACSNYQFTLSSFLKNFRLSQHSNLGFSFVMGIAEFLNPRGIIGVLTWNLILTIIAMLCLYELIQKKLLIGCTKAIAATITLAVSCSPIFLGTFAYVNVDYLLALFLIFVIYTEYKQWYVLMFFCSVILSQTKETGVVVVFGYYAYKIIIDFFCLQGSFWHRIMNYFRLNYIWVMLYTSAVYALEIVRLGAITTWVQSKDSTVSIGWFGVQFDYIVYKLKQFFILNFSWVLVIIALISIMVLLYSKFIKNRKIRMIPYNDFLGANIAFMIFSILYVTFTLQRYNIIFQISFTILAFCLFYQAFEGIIGRKLYCVILYFLTLLFVGQSFFSIDKISEKQFGTVSTVKSHMTVSSYILPFNGDGFVTNYQYSWLDRAFNKLLQTVHYNPKKQVFLTARQVSGTHLNGNGSLYRVGYDASQEKRIIIEKDADEYKINTIASYNVFTRLPYKYFRWETNSKINDYAVMYFIPYYEENIDNELEPYKYYCYVSDTKNVETFGGILYYNEMIKKDSYTSVSILELKDAVKRNKVNHPSMEDLIYEELVKSDWTENNITDYYKNNLLLNYDKNTQLVDRSVIQEGDIINMNVEVYDEMGVKLDTRYIGNYKTSIYKNVIVGENILINDIYKKLVGSNLQQTIEIACEVPENYENLIELKGKKLTFFITPLEITGYVTYKPITVERKKLIFKETENILWDVISKDIKSNVLCNTINVNYDYNLDEIERQKQTIDRYFNEYWENNEITKEKYLLEFIKCSDSEFEELKEELAKVAIREKEIDRILQSYKMYWENLYDKNEDYSASNIEKMLEESYEVFQK